MDLSEEMQKISIISINRNNAVGLRNTMDSVYSQRYSADCGALEYIVVDGASSDDSVSVIRSFEKQHSGVLLKWISEPDTSIYNAMNKGLRLASGEYCLFLNSGDRLFDNGVIEQIVKEPMTADVCYCDAVFAGECERYERAYPDRLNLDFFYNDSLCHQAIFYKRVLLLEQGGYDEQYRLIADWVMNVQLYRKGCRFAHYPLITTLYDTDGLTGTEIGIKKCQGERDKYYRSTGLWYIHPYMWLKRKMQQLWH